MQWKANFGLQTCAERFKDIYNMLERRGGRNMFCSVLLKLANLLKSWKAPLPKVNPLASSAI